MTQPLPVVSLEAKDFKSDVKPIWCPGCGDYGVLAALTKALAVLGRPPHQVVVVSGIGCSSRMPAYLSPYGFHGVHGRALPIATGIKLARPELTVVVVGGDGDGYSIGGNHFLHACRRDVDLLYVVMDNRVYGMPKGRPSPTTGPEWEGEIAPSGTGVRSFDPLSMALVAGAGFLARGFSGDPNGLARLLCLGLEHRGFAMVECLSPCVTFRPEQRAWKERAHAGPAEPFTTVAEASAALHADDGFGLGVWYRGATRVPSPRSAPVASLEDLEAELAS